MFSFTYWNNIFWRRGTSASTRINLAKPFGRARGTTCFFALAIGVLTQIPADLRGNSLAQYQEQQILATTSMYGLSHNLPGGVITTTLPTGIAEVAIPGWGDIPIVIGEDAPSEVMLPDLLYITTGGANLRSEPSTSARVLAKLAQGTYLEGLSTETESADGYEWAQVRPLYSDDSGEDLGPNGYIYTGGYVPVGSSGVTNLPHWILDLYSRRLSIPESAGMLTTKDLAANSPEFTDNSDGIHRVIDDVLQKQENAGEVSEAYAQWRNTVVSAANKVLLSDGNGSMVFDSKEMGTPRSHTVFAHYDVDADKVYVISRMENINPDVPALFVVTEFMTDTESKSSGGESFQFKASSLGYSSWDGLVVAFGIEKATEMANITALGGPEISEFAHELANQGETRLFLPGHRQFAQLGDFAKGAKLEYVKRDGLYEMIETSADGEKTVMGTYYQRGSTGRWVPPINAVDSVQELPNNVIRLLETAADEYSITYGLDGDNVVNTVTMSSMREPDGVPAALITTIDGTPMLLGRFDFESGSYDWKLATLRNIFDLQGMTVRLAGNVYMLDRYGEVLKRFNGYSLPDGHWKDPNHPSPLRPDQDTFNFAPYDRSVSFLVENGFDIQFFHLLWGLQYALPDWLLMGERTKDENRLLAENHIRSVLVHYKDEISSFVVVNEAWGNPWDDRSRYWMDELGQPTEWVPAMFRVAHDTAPDVQLVFNDFGIEVPGTRWWNPQKASQFFDMIERMRREGLPVQAGFQLHLYTADFADPREFDKLVANYRDQLRKYREADIPVIVTEFDLFPDGVDAEDLLEQNEKLVEAIVRASADEGVRDITFFGTPGYENKQPLFSSSQHPTPAYYASMRAVLSRYSGDSGKNTP